MLTVWTECSMASLTVIEQFTVVTGNLLTVYCVSATRQANKYSSSCSTITLLMGTLE